MKHAIIVHGFKGKPYTNWKPWLKRQLEAKGFSVKVPEMPNTNRPQADEWITKLSETINSLDSDQLYLVGHSLGCITILKYLETLSPGQKVQTCVLVAGFGRKFRKYPGGFDSFFERDLAWEKIKKHSKKFTVIHSRDDPKVDYGELYFLENNLNASTILVDQMRHFSSIDGAFKAPVILDAILDSADQ